RHQQLCIPHHPRSRCWILLSPGPYFATVFIQLFFRNCQRRLYCYNHRSSLYHHHLYPSTYYWNFCRKHVDLQLLGCCPRWCRRCRPVPPL
ncbi:hypothetical protein BGX20_007622, partial [Mortierella sp. AD010]